MKFFRQTNHILMSILFFSLAPLTAVAGDAEDVFAVVQKWAELEIDLEAQSELVTADRIQVFEMWRRADQTQNLRVQLAKRAATLKLHPDRNVIVTIEAPIVRVYGEDAAVVSFKRMYEVIPGNAAPSPIYLTSNSMTLVNVRGEWKIAHMHGSTA